MPHFTITGAGGSGKSRLSIALLKDVLVRDAPRHQRPRDKHQQKRPTKKRKGTG
jgi:DNA replication protein DnaC